MLAPAPLLSAKQLIKWSYDVRCMTSLESGGGEDITSTVASGATKGGGIGINVDVDAFPYPPRDGIITFQENITKIRSTESTYCR